MAADGMMSDKEVDRLIGIVDDQRRGFVSRVVSLLGFSRSKHTLEDQLAAIRALGSFRNIMALAFLRRLNCEECDPILYGSSENSGFVYQHPYARGELGSVLTRYQQLGSDIFLEPKEYQATCAVLKEALLELEQSIGVRNS